MKNLYAPGEVGDYPCGCMWRYNEDRSWTHYVNPACKFDSRYHQPIRGYHYANWTDRPEELIKAFQKINEEVRK